MLRNHSSDVCDPKGDSRVRLQRAGEGSVTDLGGGGEIPVTLKRSLTLKIFQSSSRVSPQKEQEYFWHLRN